MNAQTQKAPTGQPEQQPFFVEGQVLTAAQAAEFNQFYAERLRNNAGRGKQANLPSFVQVK